MKLFITGATGVLGRHIVPQLVQSGHQVRGLARSLLTSWARHQKGRH